MFKNLIDFTDLPPHEAIKETKELAIDADQETKEASEGLPFKPWKLSDAHILSSMLLPALTRTFMQWAHHQAVVGEATIIAAVELYRLEHGVCPEHLEEISPSMLFAVPKDPFTGENFIYKKDGENFVLYSVGENLKDDGGVALIEGENRKEETDIIWGQWKGCP